MTPSRPKVSIVIPVFNRAQLLDECIASAVAQTFHSFEVVVLDNASTDATWDVCCRWARRDARIRVYRNRRNIGPVLNWAKGISIARGEFVKLLFSDDLLFPAYLERTTPWLDDHDVGFVVTGVTIGENPKNPGSHNAWRVRTGIYPSCSFVEDTLLRSSAPVSPGLALFRRKDALESLITHVPNGLPENWLKHGAGPDCLMYLLTATRYPGVACVAEDLAFFRMHPGSFTIGSAGEGVARGYEQARLWFAQQHAPPRIRRRVFARTWLRQIYTTKVWVSPSKSLGDFGVDASWALLPAVGSELVRYLWRGFARIAAAGSKL